MFRLTIDTSNDAFREDTGATVAQLLRDVAERLENGDEGAPIRDENGNTVGEFNLTR